MSNELTLAELDGEVCEALPARTLMCHRASHVMSFKKMRRNMSFNHHHHRHNMFFGGNFSDGRGFNNGGFGSVSNFNSTRQSIFNPQTAIGFGGGGITQVGGNTNFNNSTQFGFGI